MHTWENVQKIGGKNKGKTIQNAAFFYKTGMPILYSYPNSSCLQSCSRKAIERDT